MLTVMNVINFLALIAIAASFAVIMTKNTNTTQDAIAAFQRSGNAFRVDPKNDVLTNANGDSVVTVTEGQTVSAVIIKDENSGDKVSCISMDDVAQMVVNSEKGIRNIVSVHDEDGNVNSVLAMDGNTVVTDDYVTFALGQWMVSFDSPACQGTDVDEVNVDVEIDDRDRHLVGRGLLNSHVASIKSGESRQLGSSRFLLIRLL